MGEIGRYAPYTYLRKYLAAVTGLFYRESPVFVRSAIEPWEKNCGLKLEGVLKWRDIYIEMWKGLCDWWMVLK